VWRERRTPGQSSSSVNREPTLGLFDEKGDAAPIHRTSICKYALGYHLDGSGGSASAIQVKAIENGAKKVLI
jgi:hypothetical protein